MRYQKIDRGMVAAYLSDAEAGPDVLAVVYTGYLASLDGLEKSGMAGDDFIEQAMLHDDWRKGLVAIKDRLWS